MILNILYLAITSFMITNAINNKQNLGTITKFTSYTFIAGIFVIVCNTFLNTLDGSTAIATAIIYAFTFHTLRIISIINPENNL
jgi:hypothetical protein